MKITLCGSTRFKSQFEAANELLTQAGNIVYSVAFYGHGREKPLTDWEKQVLDLVHLRKILESEAIVVVGEKLDAADPSIYYGESTRREIAWAQINDKLVYIGAAGLAQVMEFSPANTPIDAGAPRGFDA